MTLPRRTRLSLAWRTVVALAVLAVVAMAVLATAVLVTGVAAWLVALVVVGLVEYWLLAALLALDPVVWPWLSANPLPVIVLSGAVLVPLAYAGPVRSHLRSVREELERPGTPASERHPEVAATARRLAQQADVPEPTVRIANRRRPESYAVGTRTDGTVVVTRGLIRALDDAELEAVLAHEISHLANGDSRVMTLGLAPMVLADRIGTDERPTLFDHGVWSPLAHLARLVVWAALRVATAAQALGCRFGVAVLSRGREFAADASAARLTGSPAALASALRTLDGRGPPAADARTLADSAGALDILPRGDGAPPLLGTHPSTDERIARLETMAREA